MNPKITEEEIGIIKKAQAGDESAFATLFNRYKAFVDNVLYSYLRDMDEAQDLTNIVFMKVYNKLSTFRAYDTFGGWLRIIANRTALDYLRETKTTREHIADYDVGLTPEDAGGSTEDEVVNRMTYEQLLGLFESMPLNVRKVCTMFYKDNMSVQMISKNLGVASGTVKSILSRTRRKVKQKLKL